MMLLGHQECERERVRETKLAELACGSLSEQQVPPLDCALESAVRAAMRRREPCSHEAGPVASARCPARPKPRGTGATLGAPKPKPLSREAWKVRYQPTWKDHHIERAWLQEHWVYGGRIHEETS